MAIRKNSTEYNSLVSEATTKQKLVEFADYQKRRSISKIEDNEYSMVLDKTDFDTIVDSINNPKYNENLAKALKRKLIFD